MSSRSVVFRENKSVGKDRKNPQYIRKRKANDKMNLPDPKRKVWKDDDCKWKHDRFVDYDQLPKTREELLATYGYDIRNEYGTHRVRRHRKKHHFPKRKVWKDDDCKWKHDRFVDYDQLPKTREELVATYGYDIRNEEGTHRARWHRRDSKKLIQNWEDFDAYSRLSRSSRGVSPNPRGEGSIGSERGNTIGKEEFQAMVLNSDSSHERLSTKVAEEDMKRINYVPTVELTFTDKFYLRTVYLNLFTPHSRRVHQWQLNEENIRTEGGTNKDNSRRESKKEDSSRSESSRIEENVSRESKKEDSSHSESSRIEENVSSENNGRNEEFNRNEGVGRGRSFVRRGGRARPISSVPRLPHVTSLTAI